VIQRKKKYVIFWYLPRNKHTSTGSINSANLCIALEIPVGGNPENQGGYHFHNFFENQI
jgi:hypothetical protein